MMWAFEAPMALRTPISRVRSVTLTSMIFMMPMPPTTSDIAATAVSVAATVLNNSLVGSASEPSYTIS